MKENNNYEMIGGLTTLMSLVHEEDPVLYMRLIEYRLGGTAAPSSVIRSINDRFEAVLSKVNQYLLDNEVYIKRIDGKTSSRKTSKHAIPDGYQRIWFIGGAERFMTVMARYAYNDTIPSINDFDMSLEDDEYKIPFNLERIENSFGIWVEFGDDISTKRQSLAVIPKSFEFFTANTADVYTIGQLEKNIKELQESIAADERSIADKNSQLETLTWIHGFMQKNKITREDKKILKTDMIMEIAETMEEKEVCKTNIQEILSL